MRRWGSLVGVEGGGRMSKWVRGGRKGGWGVERALGDGGGVVRENEAWCVCVEGGVLC